MVWTYVLQLVIAVLFSVRLHGQLASILDHSLAAQRLTKGFDLGVLADTFMRMGEGPSGGPAAPYAGVPLFALLYLLLTAGTLFVYQLASGQLTSSEVPETRSTGGSPIGERTIVEKARLSTLLSIGLRYFWRFVRLLLIAAPVTLLILAPLSALRTHWLKASDDHGVIEQALFIRGLITSAAIALIACALRLYFDLTEVYTVQLGLRGDRRIRKSLAPAWRALRSNFAPAYGSFLLIAILGYAAFGLFSWAALLHLTTTYVFFLFLLSQIGIFLLLASRFWQRGMETALALAFPISLASSIVEPLAAPQLPAHPEAESAAARPVSDPIPDPEPEPPYFPPSSSQEGEPNRLS